MNSKDYHKVCEEVDDIVASTSKDKDIVHNLEDMELDEANNLLKSNVVEVNEPSIEVDAIKSMYDIQTEDGIMEHVEPLMNNIHELQNEKIIFEENENNDLLRDISSSNEDSILQEASLSQDNIITSSVNLQSTSPSSESFKIKRSISKGELNGDSSFSTKNFDDGADEDLSKRQKLNENVCNKLNSDSSEEDIPKSVQNEEQVEDTGMRFETSTSMPFTRTGSSDRGLVVSSDGSDIVSAEDDNDANEWTTATEDELEKVKDDEWLQHTVACLKKESPKPNWFVVPELIHREIGINPLFRYKYYASLHVVERFELMYELKEHEGCVNALNFNRKGNLLASGSDDLAVVIWDWAVGKKHNVIINSGHRSNIFQVKWLPCDEENLMATCGRDGAVRLLDLKSCVSRRLALHYAATHKLAVHPDMPHIIISVGEDAKVLSIDIREKKPNKLLVVKDGSSHVQLYSVHSNPLKSYEFCVGGRSQVVRIYDRRKVSEPVHKLYPEHLARNKHAHVTCAVYNYNGTEVVATYNDEDIYLFDTVSPQPGDFAHRYHGHRNNATVKGVNFFGPKGEYIISGSDCGNIFIYDKNTEAIVNSFHGDRQGVVNCLEPHPEFPYLATSGLDFDVKIWVPSCEYPPNLMGVALTVKLNSLARKQNTNTESDIFENQMNWVLLRTIGRRNRIRALNALRGTGFPNEDDDEDDDEIDVDTSDDDSSVYSGSQSDGPAMRTLQCPPS